MTEAHFQSITAPWFSPPCTAGALAALSSQDPVFQSLPCCSHYLSSCSYFRPSRSQTGSQSLPFFCSPPAAPCRLAQDSHAAPLGTPHCQVGAGFPVYSAVNPLLILRPELSFASLARPLRPFAVRRRRPRAWPCSASRCSRGWIAWKVSVTWGNFGHLAHLLLDGSSTCVAKEGASNCSHTSQLHTGQKTLGGMGFYTAKMSLGHLKQKLQPG